MKKYIYIIFISLSNEKIITTKRAIWRSGLALGLPNGLATLIGWVSSGQEVVDDSDPSQSFFHFLCLSPPVTRGSPPKFGRLDPNQFNWIDWSAETVRQQGWSSASWIDGAVANFPDTASGCKRLTSYANGAGWAVETSDVNQLNNSRSLQLRITSTWVVRH